MLSLFLRDRMAISVVLTIALAAVTIYNGLRPANVPGKAQSQLKQLPPGGRTLAEVPRAGATTPTKPFDSAVRLVSHEAPNAVELGKAELTVQDPNDRTKFTPRAVVREGEVSRLHAQFTADSAEIDNYVGGQIIAYAGNLFLGMRKFANGTKVKNVPFPIVAQAELIRLAKSQSGEVEIHLHYQGMDGANSVSVVSAPVRLLMPAVPATDAKLENSSVAVHPLGGEMRRAAAEFDLFKDEGPFISLNARDIEKLELRITGLTVPAGGGVLAVFQEGELISDKRLASTPAPASPNRFLLHREDLATILDRGVKKLDIVWTDKDGNQRVGDPLRIRIDTRGPIISAIRTRLLTYTKDVAKVTVDVEFDELDLDKTSAELKTNYRIERLTEDGNYGIIQGPNTAEITGGVVRLTFNELESGVYRLSILGHELGVDNDQQTRLRDIAKNFVGGDSLKGQTVEKIFGVDPTPEKVKNVEFPEFLATAPQPESARKINPADKVETRVIRLFYFRDAHRVAQLINRTAQSLNRQAVVLAEQRASDARDNADALTDAPSQRTRSGPGGGTASKIREPGAGARNRARA